MSSYDISPLRFVDVVKMFISFCICHTGSLLTISSTESRVVALCCIESQANEKCIFICQMAYISFAKKSSERRAHTIRQPHMFWCEIQKRIFTIKFGMRTTIYVVVSQPLPQRHFTKMIRTELNQTIVSDRREYIHFFKMKIYITVILAVPSFHFDSF